MYLAKLTALFVFLICHSAAAQVLPQPVRDLSNPSVYQFLIELPEVQAELEMTEVQLAMIKQHSKFAERRIVEFGIASQELNHDPDP